MVDTSSSSQTGVPGPGFPGRERLRLGSQGGGLTDGGGQHGLRGGPGGDRTAALEETGVRRRGAVDREDEGAGSPSSLYLHR